MRHFLLLLKRLFSKGLRSRFVPFFKYNFFMWPRAFLENKNHKLKYMKYIHCRKKFKRHGKLVYLIIIMINILLTIFFRRSASTYNSAWQTVTVDKCTIEDILSVKTSNGNFLYLVYSISPCTENSPCCCLLVLIEKMPTDFLFFKFMHRYWIPDTKNNDLRHEKKFYNHATVAEVLNKSTMMLCVSCIYFMGVCTWKVLQKLLLVPVLPCSNSCFLLH